ncbi:MAG TPA: hypothetical protein VLV83_14055 [Acidobacteriota bacterium]|nr:hypothetical protein [Acidobacteriota bacterium]
MHWTKKLLLVGLAVTVMTGLMAHPHMSKTVTTKVNGVDVKLSFFTAPANESHLEGIEDGAFNKAFASINFAADLTVNGHTFTAGDYHVGAIKKGDTWVMGLHEGRLGFDEAADASKVTELDSEFQKLPIRAEHINFDIVPGHGDMEGRAVLTWTFGNLHLAGAISDKTAE